MVKVSVDLGKAQRKLSDASVQRGRYALANQALADMNQFVPKDDGILRMSATIDINGKAINYNTPYANRLFRYYMYNYTTPGTGPRWDLKATPMFMSDWIKAFNKGAGWN